jgi:hypothetical protein
MTRIDIINALIQKHNYKSYIEIGVRNPDHCFNHINCEIKHGVDPGVEGEWKTTFNMTSDEFFASNPQTYDLIFIDGLHIDEQVEKDIINSLKYINKGGSIVLHDCNPPTEYHARENYYDHNTPAGPPWNGTVWKAVVKVRSEVDGIFTSVVDTDWGVGIIQKSNKGNKITNYNQFYSFNKFAQDRKYYINLISPEEFILNYISSKPVENKPFKVITLLTSFNRPHYIENMMKSLKEIREPNIINDVYIVENSHTEYKEEVLRIINENKDDRFIIHNPEFNLGQRASLLQMLEDINLDDYDFIQFTDQDNLFLEPISTYCNVLNNYPTKQIVTGYMSKEHQELGWVNSEFGRLCEKRSCRAGHMMFRVKDFKNILPIPLDSQQGQPHNSAWNAGLDWELTHWNPRSPAQNTQSNFILCVPGGVIHKGLDSTFIERNIEKDEYTLDELKKLRNK